MINTVLIIDDNALDNAILRNYLYSERYNVISALNGREALELIESRNIDLVILDLNMPVMDGYEFLKEFSKTEFFREIPIIVTSSIDNEKDIEHILSYNVYDYIIKPLSQGNRMILVNKIKNAVQHRLVLSKLNKANKLIEKISAPSL